MLPLLLSATLLAGLDYTRGVGEQQKPSLALAAGARSSWSGVEALYVRAAKEETGQGYLATAAVELLGPWKLLAGVRYSFRDGGPWQKQTLWGRAGIRSGDYTLLAEHAFSSPNQENKLEGRMRLFSRPLAAEFRMFVLFHSTGRGAGWSLLLGKEI
jgi:hypothetical protein